MNYPGAWSLSVRFLGWGPAAIALIEVRPFPGTDAAPCRSVTRSPDVSQHLPRPRRLELEPRRGTVGSVRPGLELVPRDLRRAGLELELTLRTSGPGARRAAIDDAQRPPPTG